MKEVLYQRCKTHGPFEGQSRIAQMIKASLRSSPRWALMAVEHQEALDMIAVKMSRVVSGDSYFRDHWDDIVGYATRASEAVPYAPES